jgi:hypothetical protein
MTSEKLKYLTGVYGVSHYEFNDSQGHVSACKWLNKQTFDCSGLIVWALQQLKLIKTGNDYTAESLYSKLCNPIKAKDLKIGDLVFVKNTRSIIEHVGIYAGNSKTVEAIGTRKGVVEGNSERFNVYGRLNFFKNEANTEDELKQALLFISKNSGIDYDTWYKKTKEVQWLDVCFIKIAKAFQK